MKGISWLPLIWKGAKAPDVFAGSVAEAQEIVMKLNKSQYEIRCGQLIVSLHDSEFLATDLEVKPMVDDNIFFDASEYQRTRFNIVLPLLRISGLDYQGLLQGKIYHTRFIQIRDASLDILVNMYKPLEQDTSNNLKSNDFMSTIKEKIQVDSFNTTNVQVKYGESYTARSNPEIGYKIRCGELHASLHDSNIVANDLDIHPLMDDNEYFDESRFRRTTFRMVLAELRVNGLDCKGLVQNKIYHARSVQINDASLDVSVDMYKPYERDTVKFLMPNEMLASMKEIINVDSISITKGQLIYAEFSTARSNPAVVMFNNVALLAEGMSNNNKHGDTLVIHANANFMESGMMKVIMHIPLTSPKFCLQYSGTLGTMELNKLNSFVEIAEHKRVKSGIVHSASFDIQVNDGHAKGSVRAAYEDFKLAILDSKTGSEKGIMNKIKSFLANTFKLHGTNKKDNAGILKLGKVHYTRFRDDTFTQFAWFALRSGVADIIGF
jgi:hypothetical protein